uniref:site-specific DNA-methyltransferase (adenine-specific) n=1 Tax=Klebsiella pneumoniae TaxID=573 RepID=A0A2P1BP77_KLEPN|nr:N-6 DNA Methylase [Klebsiella pneumoniae]
MLVPHGQELEPETHAVCVAGMLIRRLESDPAEICRRTFVRAARCPTTSLPVSVSTTACPIRLSARNGRRTKPLSKRNTKKASWAGLVRACRKLAMAPCCFDAPASKLELPINGGGRAAIVLSGSPLFNGGAASGESEIRRWLLEDDLIEAIVALPTDLFFRTNIATYLWILSNKKPQERKGKVQLINATDLWTSIRNEGNKRRIVSDEQRRQILDIYAAGETGALSRMLDYRTFGYRRIRVLRPLRMTLELDKVGMERLEAEAAREKLSDAHQTFWREALKPLIGQTQPYSWAETFVSNSIKSDEAKQLKVKSNKTLITALINAFGHKDPKAEPVTDSNGELVPDTDLTDYENVPYLEDIDDYFAREVLPHVPDARLDESFTDARDGQLGRVGYEINFNRFFYQYQPPRKLHDIDEDLKQVEAEIAALLAEVASE